MRVAKHRTLLARPATKTGETIVFQTLTRNWRDRVRAMKAAQDAEQGNKDDGATAKLQA